MNNLRRGRNVETGKESMVWTRKDHRSGALTRWCIEVRTDTWLI